MVLRGRRCAMGQGERRLYLIERLLAERGDGGTLSVPCDAEGQRQLLRALLNVRPPAGADEEFLAVQDAYLAGRLSERGGPVSVDETRAVDDKLRLWQGDITLLAAGGIVNAANSAMLGCFVPGHFCIDNAIHTYAGVQLRLECARIMETQGYPEPTGMVKATAAYNLPSQVVLHTVGPIVEGGAPSQTDRGLLASSYRSCLAEATALELRTLAFCCISTGVFGFPPRDAAEIALATVRAFLAENPAAPEVIFNVFTARDREIYESLL